MTLDIIRPVGDPAVLGECPVWSVAEQVLYWADIDGRSINRLDPATATITSRSLTTRPGSFVLTDVPGRMVVGTEHELVIFDWESGHVASWLELEEAGTGNRMNDGRCDPAGRYVVGSMYEDTSAGRATGELHRVRSDGVTEILRSGIGVTNGLAFDAERGRMYFADSPTERVVVFDYDIDTGAMTNERLFFDYRDIPGKPDGACLDADGCYWSASVHGWAVIRVTPNGRVDRRIDLPVAKPSMPCFGGHDLDTLYVTSIGVRGATPSEPATDGFEHGHLLAVDAGVQGRPEPIFQPT